MVAELSDLLRSRGCNVLVSNSDQPRMRKLYHHWHVYELPVLRWVAANGSRLKVGELVIRSHGSERG